MKEDCVWMQEIRDQRAKAACYSPPMVLTTSRS